MASIHGSLREAARTGSAVKLRDLLLDPSCDALAKDKMGMTALMWAAFNGDEACVSLLLPLSDVLAQDRDGSTALRWAADRGHQSLARLIDAYVLAQVERKALEAQAGPGTPHGQATLRV